MVFIKTLNHPPEDFLKSNRIHLHLFFLSFLTKNLSQPQFADDLSVWHKKKKKRNDDDSENKKELKVKLNSGPIVKTKIYPKKKKTKKRLPAFLKSLH